MARDWSSLNIELLRLIAAKFRTLEELLKLGIVCKNWSSALIKQEEPIISRLQLPWLMLPCCDHKNEDGSSQCQHLHCFSILRNKSLYLDFLQASSMKCVGSSHGWLVMVEDTSPAIFMLNPLTKQRLELPPVTTMPGILGFNKDDVGHEYILECVRLGTIIGRKSAKDIARVFMSKVILSNDPGEEDCIVAALCGHGNKLVFCRIGDKNWTKIDHELRPSQTDVLFSNGKVYLINWDGFLRVFDASNPQDMVIYQPPPELENDDCDQMYLAIDINGELLCISRLVDMYDSISEAEHGNDDDYVGGNDDDYVGGNDVDYIGDNDDIDGNNNNVNNHDSHKIYYRTKTFNIFKLNEKENKWDKLINIGENIVFLGENQSICYSAAEFPECSKNTIYFTDEYWDYGEGLYGGQDIGIFNIDDDVIKRIPCSKEAVPLKIFPWPIWFAPSIRSV